MKDDKKRLKKKDRGNEWTLCLHLLEEIQRVLYKKYIFVSITKSEVSGKYYTIFCFNIKWFIFQNDF